MELSPGRSVYLGIDTGGTFTDLVAFDERSGTLSTLKTPSVAAQPGLALFNAITDSAVPVETIAELIHGTTVCTNALIERTGARVGFLTTRGHEDIPYIQRINRKTLYDLKWNKPKPLLQSRRDCLGIDERMGSDGQEIRAIDLEDVVTQCQTLRERGVEAVAICLLFSYVSPEHERMVADIVARELPGVPISVSHEVAPIWREYERASTTIANTYLKPLMGGYVRSLTESLADIEMTAPWTIMKSNGGAMKADAAVANPIQTAQSGPAGGMIAAAALGRQAGEPNLLTLDMGGTSADVGLIIDGEQKHTTEYEIEWGIPAAVPLIDIKSIGAGGGSIAWIDAGGFLRVGPQSARALPGPACYGRGGTLPTVTDANVVLGRIDPENFLGGRMSLDRGAAEIAIAPLAAKLDMSIVELAAAITGIADENMAGAVKMISIERGYDPRRFTLFAFGGAGPLHACSVARALRVPKVLIPIFPGNASALGMLIAERRVDKVWTQAFRSTHVDETVVTQQFQQILDAALTELRNEGFTGVPTVTYSINMRYLGQNYEQDVPIVLAEGEGMLQAAYRTFEEHHAALYGYTIENEVIELVSFRVTVQGARPAIRLAVEPDTSVDARRADRSVYFRGHGYVNATVWNRYSLPFGSEIDGPAVLEEPGSTTLVEPGTRARVLDDGQLLIVVEGVSEGVV